MAVGPSRKKISPCVVMSRVCGHDYEYLVPSLGGGTREIREIRQRRRDEEIAHLEAQPCVDCRSAASKAEWERTLADAAERGWSYDFNRRGWLHTCGRVTYQDEVPATCRTCDEIAENLTTIRRLGPALFAR